MRDLPPVALETRYLTRDTAELAGHMKARVLLTPSIASTITKSLLSRLANKPNKDQVYWKWNGICISETTIIHTLEL